MDKSFSPGNSLRKIFNRNTIKISYSCVSNFKQTIDNHNKRQLATANSNTPQNGNTTDRSKSCNCRKKDTWPLHGKCLEKAVIYQATVTRADTGEPGLTANDFKSRYRSHMVSFRNNKWRNSTELSKYIWSLKDSNTEFSNVWRIISCASPYNSASKRCNLCLNEKLIIIFELYCCTLNKRSELISSCRHRTKSLQCNNWICNSRLNQTPDEWGTATCLMK